MKQTPIQKAISQIKEEIRTSNTDNNYSAGYKQALINTENRLLDLLPYEQECIEEAAIIKLKNRFIELQSTYNEYSAGHNCFGIAANMCDEYLYTSPVEFDAKKVAEGMYDKISIIVLESIGRIKHKAIVSVCKIALDYSHYTPTQRQQILNELEKL